MGCLSTIDLLVLTSLDQLIFILKIVFSFYTKQEVNCTESPPVRRPCFISLKVEQLMQETLPEGQGSVHLTSLYSQVWISCFLFCKYYVLLYKISYLIEEVNYTYLSPSVWLPCCITNSCLTHWLLADCYGILFLIFLHNIASTTYPSIPKRSSLCVSFHLPLVSEWKPLRKNCWHLIQFFCVSHLTSL